MNILRQASLVEQVEALQERVKYLEALIGRDTHLPRAWGLSPLEEKIVSYLYKHGFATKEQLIMTLWMDRDEPEFAESNMKIHLSRARRKLEPLDIKIETIWGKGLEMPARSRAIIKQVLDQ